MVWEGVASARCVLCSHSPVYWCTGLSASIHVQGLQGLPRCLSVRGGRCSLWADTGHLQGFLSPGGPGFRIAKDHLDHFECRGSQNRMLAWV